MCIPALPSTDTNTATSAGGGSASSSPTTMTTTTNFLSIPPELHLLITPHLPYPDLLALKHTHPAFYRHQALHPTVYDRIDWLLDRPRQGLPIPRATKCVMRSDELFCANAEVRSILSLRRRHVECRRYGPGTGMCLVVQGNVCWKGMAENKGRLAVGWHWYWRRGFSKLSFNLDGCWRLVILASQILLGLALAVVVGMYWSGDASRLSLHAFGSLNS